MSYHTRTTERAIIKNTIDHTLTLVLEPWANEYELPSGAELIVEGEGPAQNSGFDTTQEDDLVVVWAWGGSDARILHPDDRVVADWTGLRVPEPPSGER